MKEERDNLIQPPCTGARNDKNLSGRENNSTWSELLKHSRVRSCLSGLDSLGTDSLYVSTIR